MFRKFQPSLLLVFVLAILVACGSSDDSTETSGSNSNNSEKKQLVIVDFGGASSEAAQKTKYEPFAEEYGVEVIVESPVDYGQLISMIDSGNVTWDVVTADHDIALKLAAEGKLEELDYSIIDSSGMDPDIVTDYTIGIYLSATAISWNTEAIDGEPPKTWEDVWNLDKFDGNRTFWEYPLTTFEAALLADGVPPEELYPIDIDRALASLDKIKDQTIFWSGGAQAIDMLNAQDVVLGGAWNGRVVDAKVQGSPLEVEYNQAIVMTDSYIIPKGAPNKEIAQQYLAFASQPKPQAEFAKLMHYAPTNLDAHDLLTDEEKVLLGTTVDTQIKIDYSWWVDNIDEATDRFNKWLLE